MSIADDRAMMQDALDAGRMYPGLEDDIKALEQRLLDTVRAELQSGLTSESVDKLNNLATLANRYAMDDLAARLDTRREMCVATPSCSSSSSVHCET